MERDYRYAAWNMGGAPHALLMDGAPLPEGCQGSGDNRNGICRQFGRCRYLLDFFRLAAVVLVVVNQLVFLPRRTKII